MNQSSDNLVKSNHLRPPLLIKIFVVFLCLAFWRGLCNRSSHELYQKVVFWKLCKNVVLPVCWVGGGSVEYNLYIKLGHYWFTMDSLFIEQDMVAWVWLKCLLKKTKLNLEIIFFRLIVVRMSKLNKLNPAKGISPIILMPFIINSPWQGCISCGILVSGIRARGVSSEHMENREMFSCSPT